MRFSAQYLGDMAQGLVFWIEGSRFKVQGLAVPRTSEQVTDPCSVLRVPGFSISGCQKQRDPGTRVQGVGSLTANLPHIMHLSISSRKSTPPQKLLTDWCLLLINFLVDAFVGELTS